MATQRYINNFATTVKATFGSSDTFLQVTSAAGLPALTGGDFFDLTLFRQVGIVESGHEVVKVTAVTGTQLTVVRAVEGAAASQFAVGDRIEARVTATSLETMSVKLAGLKTVASTGSFIDLTDKPTSLASAGITNAYTKTEIDQQEVIINARISAVETATGNKIKQMYDRFLETF